MTLVVLREVPTHEWSGAYLVSFHEEDGMPGYDMMPFDSELQAREAYTELEWEQPPEDADNDILAIAYID